MNIWLVHPYAGGPHLGRHWRPYWLAEAWNRMGHRPIVICANFHHLMTGASRAAGPQRIGEVDFWFVTTPRYNDNGFGRLWNNVAFGFQFRKDAANISAQFGKPDVVIASTPHLFFVRAARQIARRFGAKFWIEVRDLWPKSIVALGLARAWHPFVKLTGWQERFAYRAADRVISLLRGAEAHMISNGLRPGRFVWVPNGVSEAEMQSAREPPVLNHELIQQLKARGKRVVIYAGAIGPPNAMEVVVDAAVILSETQPDIHFVLIGSGVSRQQLQHRATGLPNVEFHNEVERPVVQAMLQESDCAIISFHSNELYDHGVGPNKLFDYCLFAPRSLIACDPEALIGLEDLVTLRCEPGNPLALSRALSEALSCPTRHLDQRLSVIRQFSYSELAARYLA